MVGVPDLDSGVSEVKSCPKYFLKLLWVKLHLGFKVLSVFVKQLLVTQTDEWKIYMKYIIYYCTVGMKSNETMLPRSYERKFLCIEKPENFQDFNGVWTCDLAIPVRCSNQLSYEATDVGSRSLLGSQLLSLIFFHFLLIITYHGKLWTQKWPVPNGSGFIAQLVRASHRYREVTGSTPLKSWKISGFSTQMNLRS